MKQATRAAVLVAVVLATFGAGDQTPASPKSAAAVAAIKKANVAIADAQKSFDAAVSKARKTEATELRTAGKQAAAKGDADEIVAIAAEVKEVEAATPVSAIGQWEFVEANGGHVTWKITADRAGHTRTADVARPEFSGDEVVVRWPSGWIDRLTFAGSRAFWESFSPGQDTNGPAGSVLTGHAASRER